MAVCYSTRICKSPAVHTHFSVTHIAERTDDPVIDNVPLRCDVHNVRVESFEIFVYVGSNLCTVFSSTGGGTGIGAVDANFADFRFAGVDQDGSGFVLFDSEAFFLGEAGFGDDSRDEWVVLNLACFIPPLSFGRPFGFVFTTMRAVFGKDLASSQPLLSDS